MDNRHELPIGTALKRGDSPSQLHSKLGEVGLSAEGGNSETFSKQKRHKREVGLGGHYLLLALPF